MKMFGMLILAMSLVSEVARAVPEYVAVPHNGKILVSNGVDEYMGVPRRFDDSTKISPALVLETDDVDADDIAIEVDYELAMMCKTLGE